MITVPRHLSKLVLITGEYKLLENLMPQAIEEQQFVPAITLGRTSKQIQAEIVAKFGFVPPFFEPAEPTPQVLENLWQQTLTAYVNNPLPALFKEKLSAYLSRFCAVPYCMITRSCTLRPLGLKAREVLELLEAPPPAETDIDEHLLLLAAQSDLLTVWPESNSKLEASLLYCSIFIALRDSSEYCRQKLHRILGSVNYNHLVTFIAYVKTCHLWIEAHPTVAYEADRRVQENLGALLEEEPDLADFFRNYRERVRRESQSRAELAERKRQEEALQQVTEQGNEIIVSSRRTLVRNEEDHPKLVLVVNTDITEKKQLEAQLLRAQRLEILGTLASGIAHDLNNILTPILAAAQLLPLKFPHADQQAQQLLQILETSAKRGAGVIKQILSFGRGLEGNHTIFQLRHLVKEIRHIVKETFPKSIELDIDIAPDLWSVFGDATQLHQVLMNLVVNARDAMPHGGTLRICAENLFIDSNYAQMHLEAQVGPYIVVTVADTGTGMPPKIIKRIFEPFFTTKEVGGTGLGLSTVMGIIKSHGGFVNVYSEVGKGTEFKLYLPVVEGTETLEASDVELPKGHGELIFVVDDEVAIREITKTSLETYKYKVLTASDGIEAIALYAQHKHEISAVLMDIMMPSMDGLAAIRILQKMNPQVKIIALSGLSSNQKMAEAAGSGVKAFLSKPYTAQELLKTINVTLSTN